MKTENGLLVVAFFKYVSERHELLFLAAFLSSSAADTVDVNSAEFIVCLALCFRKPLRCGMNLVAEAET